MGVFLGQNFGQIRSNVVKKVKKMSLLIVFFHILHWEYLLKHKVVVVQRPEWKFNPNKAGLFEGSFSQGWGGVGGQFEPPFIFQKELI